MFGLMTKRRHRAVVRGHKAMIQAQRNENRDLRAVIARQVVALDALDAKYQEIQAEAEAFEQRLREGIDA